MDIETLVEEVIEALEEGNWERVCRKTAHLIRESRRNCLLNDASRDAMGLALFMLEQPVFEQCSLSLSRIAIAQLEEGWWSYHRRRR